MYQFNYLRRQSFLLTFSLLVASMVKALITEYQMNQHRNNNIPPLHSTFAQLIDEPIAWNAVVGEADRAFRRGMQVRYLLLQKFSLCLLIV
mmetsp:Transcript_3164/g.3570  ORF Transcript_3164/g.3570 Transcript_3164/m.3570 type:complete len:91 (+) Transcript_3164:34-306(+)